ncbi:MAG: hypothetical protein QOH36_366 [Actinomycetota bacterium]|nr:hypothetical protein [Actinomycetota bacterium]
MPDRRGRVADAARRASRPIRARLVRKRDEQGAILILGSLGMVMAVIMSSFAIDLGTLAQDARRVQLVADMVALDAMRALPANPTATAQASAVRNGFPYTDGEHTLLVEWGPTRLGPFTSLPANLASATAVRVTASTLHHQLFPFVSQTPQNVSRKAVGNIQPRAGFTIGSSLVTIDTARSSLLNSLIGQSIHGSAISLGLASWQGLASGSIGITALQTQLATMGFSVGTVSELLSANMTLAQLYQATANALTLGGDAANASVFNTLRLAVTSSTQMNLGGLIQVAQGSDTAALASSLNLFQLVTGSALLINGTNTLSIPNFVATIPGVLSTGISLKVTELPQTYIGPIGGSVSTGQVDLVITPKIDVNLSLGLSLLRVTGDLPVRLTLGGATGTLSGATCTGITVSADPNAVTGVAQLTTLRVSVLSIVPVLDVGITTFTPTIDGPAVPLSFSYPSEFAPPAFSKHAGSQPVGLQTLTTHTAGTVTLLGSIPLGLSQAGIVSGVLGLLPGLLGGADTNVVTPLLTALGLDVGSADVTALKNALQCTVPGLAG